MFVSSRVLTTLPATALLLFAAACGGGGGEQPESQETTTTTAAADAPAAATTPAAATAPTSSGTGKVIIVRMVTTQNGAAGRYEPAQINAKPGDIIRFVTDGQAPHNVNFPAADNPSGAKLPPVSPYLTAPEQTHEMKVEMGPGGYKFQCDPHVMMGMKGELTVQQ